ncbi:Conserved hypothetical protein [Vibrio atlanticus]|uniref:HipA-like C-terminal domain-containing protein n=1 Tax=Vibrio atlanticus (strain LGP32) TaxID=575788 RepID=B7VMR3_VIBA3|nr:Conserved hypothetical protein [Vibrio atlanticus]
MEVERFVHAGSYFKRMIPEFDDKMGKEHNLTDMAVIIRFLSMKASLKTNGLLWIAEMALFDALIGNTDRHQENWGVVYEQGKTARLSPLFDNGTSLGHERFTDNIKGWDNHRLKAYVKKGKHHLRLEREETKSRVPHFLLVKALFGLNQECSDHIKQKVDNLDLVSMLAEIEDLTKIKAEVPFTQERFEWIQKNLKVRFELIKEELKQ